MLNAVAKIEALIITSVAILLGDGEKRRRVGKESEKCSPRFNVFQTEHASNGPSKGREKVEWLFYAY